MHTSVLQNLEVRCRKLAEQLQDVSGEVESIRTSMESQMSISTGAPPSEPRCMRERTISEHSEVTADDLTILLGTLPINARRKPIVRSLTEVRPDALIFDNGQHIEYIVPEEEGAHDDSLVKSG